LVKVSGNSAGSRYSEIERSKVDNLSS
jgi:hypothetical protein